MIRDQLEAEIVAANEAITRTEKGNFDLTYKEFWIDLQRKHIAVCTAEISALDKMLYQSNPQA